MKRFLSILLALVFVFPLIAIGLPSPVLAQPAEGLVAYYPFNGNANDESGNNHHGTVNGAILAVDRFGNVNSAYNFDGNNDYIEVPDHAHLDFGTGSFTVSAWVKTTATTTVGSGRDDILAKGDPTISGLAISMRNNKAVFWVGPSGEFYGSSVLNDGEWHQIVGIRDDSGNIVLYVDGIVECTGINNQNVDTGHSVFIGKHGTKNESYFDGFIDDVCIYNQEIEVLPVPDISVTTTYVDFGSLESGSSSQPETITITNDGTASLIIGEITIGGPNANQFSIASDNASSQILPPNALANVMVTFDPTSTGKKLAALSIPSNDPDEKSFYVLLSGFAGPAPVKIYTVSPDNIQFGSIQVGSSSLPEYVTITSVLFTNLPLGTLYIDGADASQFAILNDNASGRSLARNESANFSVQFSPTSSGNKTAELFIPTFPPDPHPFTLPLSGIGTTLSVPVISVAPTFIDFGFIQVGSTSSTENATITNHGTTDLIIDNITIDDNQFTIYSGNISGLTLAPNVSANITLVFTPTSSGVHSATLYITSNDPDEDPVTVSLSGSGFGGPEPDISVTPESVDFGTVLIGSSSSTKVITITNDGITDLSIETLSILGDDASHFTIVSDNASERILAPAASANISVQFRPTAAGKKSANLSIPSNDPDENTVIVTLSGSGSPEPDISVTPKSVDFGTVPVGSSSSIRVITITNDGNTVLNIETLSILGASAGHFAIISDNASGQTIVTATTANVSVQFIPTTAGGKTAYLLIPSDDPDENPVIVCIGGNHPAPPPPIPLKPDINVSPTSIDFSSVAVGSTSANRTITVSNAGTANLTISDNVSIMGPNADQFLIVSDNCSGKMLAPSDNATLQVVFSPTSSGSKTATLSIWSNDPDESPFNVALTGYGVAPTEIENLADAYVNSETPDTNYGNSTSLIAGTETWMSSVKTIYLKFNISSIPPNVTIIDAAIYLTLGAGPFCGNSENISAYHVTDTTWSEETITFNNSPPLKAASEDTVSVFGTPPNVYRWSVTQMVKQEYENESENVSIALRGEGPGQCDKPFFSKEHPSATERPYIEVSYSPLFDINVTPISIDFGVVAVGSVSANRTVTVSNAGTANLTISDNVTITGPNADQFLIVSDNCSGETLVPSDNTTLEVVFSPTSNGNKTATLSIWSNDPDEPTANVTLYGYGATLVRVDAPATVPEDADFEVYVDIDYVEDLNAAQYDIWFDPAVLRLDNVTDGLINSTNVSAAYNEIDPGHLRVVNSMGVSAVTGSGYLAVLHFHSIGALGTVSDINITDGLLGDMEANSIPASWIGDHVEVSVIPGDANGDNLINIFDMTKVARIILELDDPTPGADANQDGSINIFDMTKIARIILELD